MPIKNLQNDVNLLIYFVCLKLGFYIITKLFYILKNIMKSQKYNYVYLIRAYFTSCE